MRPKLFYIVIVLLYLMSPYFIREYFTYGAFKQDQASIETGIVSTGGIATPDQSAQMDEINQQEDELKEESYGYLGGAIFLILCPTFMLFFRRRIIA